MKIVVSLVVISEGFYCDTNVKFDRARAKLWDSYATKKNSQKSEFRNSIAGVLL